ncbi:TonB-dependent receptor [Sphingobium scionense]|uniref:Iron complex outermembrane receptor protein n=1 Tax=Sphingobium scionense TaxID=1404341 RepID=A0A7W6LV98_9SPHN|nr:TonB-dependent receptor [Sphingobium scionense]MBB4150056.1 iron complex outermembrane receptor protein [Sphingobium scionense]
MSVSSLARACAGSASIALATWAISPAFAQDNAGSTQSVGVEDIVVTAERREQNLQDVPISATVLNAEQMARRGVTSIADLQQVAPSVAINQVNRSTYVNIRGVGIAQTSPSSSPGIAYYVDGQLIPHEQFIGQSFYDVGSIEVLRGPQGTLTGQNSTGGAIYVRTPEPKFDDLSGFVEQTIGNYDSYRTVAALNISDSDQVALRIAGTHDERDSFTRNIGSSPSNPGDVNLWAGRINLAMRSADHSLRVNVRGEYFDSNSDNAAIKRRNDTVSTDPFVIEEDAIAFLHQRGLRLSGEVRYALSDGVEIRGLTSWQDGKTTDQADGDRTNTALPRPPAANVGRVSYTNTRFKTWINEVNLLSTGNGPLSWVVGAFVLDETIPASILRDNNHTVDFVSATSTIETEIQNNSKSLFGQINWHFTDQLELVAGARHSWDKQVYNRIASAGGIGVTQTKSSQWTGKVGLNYTPVDDVLLYVSASKGYKAGGGNLPVAAAPFGPETNYVYEGGFKTTMWDRHLRVNGSLFYSDYRDIQLASLANGLPLTQNAARGRSWGGELEVTAQFGGFSLNAGGGYLNAEFARDALLQNTVTNQNEMVRKGDVLPYSPKLTVNAGVQYAIPVGDRTLTPRLQWSHISTSYVTPFPGDQTVVPARDIVDARLTFDLNESLRLEAFANNIFDKTYIANQLQNSSTADGGIVYGAPRQYGGRLTYRF